MSVSSTRVQQTHSIQGSVNIPGDKSISHRALMLGSLTHGDCYLSNFLMANDCLATLKIMRALGVRIDSHTTDVTIHGVGIAGLTPPTEPLDCQNSGTTIRLLSGLLAGLNIPCTLEASPQLRKRPMGRVIDPLRLMGANIDSKNGYPPLKIRKSTGLHAIDYELPMKSAQVKSALILAGLNIYGETNLKNTEDTRDHTERLLEYMGKDFAPFDMRIPGDPSSAAFLIVAATTLADSQLVLKQVGINRTRTGLLDALKAMGANIELSNKTTSCGEPVADILVKSSSLKAQSFGGDIIVRMIDELPILAVAATQAHGQTIIKNAEELKVKETNRIDTTVSELKKMGANIEATQDGFIVNGPCTLHGASVDSHGDHRLAMALCVAGLLAHKETYVKNTDVHRDSFPNFMALLKSLGVQLEDKTA